VSVVTVTNVAHLSTIFHHFKLAKTNSPLRGLFIDIAGTLAVCMLQCSDSVFFPKSLLIARLWLLDRNPCVLPYLNAHGKSEWTLDNTIRETDPHVNHGVSKKNSHR